MLMEIKTHVEAAKTALQKEHDKKRFLDPLSGEKTDQKREGAGDIIVERTHEFAAEGAREGVEAGGISVQDIPKAFIEVHILAVQVKNQNGAVSEGIDTAAEIHQIHEDHGYRERNGQISIFAIDTGEGGLDIGEEILFFCGIARIEGRKCTIHRKYHLSLE